MESCAGTAGQSEAVFCKGTDNWDEQANHSPTKRVKLGI